MVLSTSEKAEGALQGAGGQEEGVVNEQSLKGKTEGLGEALGSEMSREPGAQSAIWPAESGPS